MKQALEHLLKAIENSGKIPEHDFNQGTELLDWSELLQPSLQLQAFFNPELDIHSPEFLRQT